MSAGHVFGLLITLCRVLAAFRLSASRKNHKNGGTVHDFWVIDDADSVNGSAVISISAVRLTAVAENALTKAGKEMTVECFSKFFESNNCSLKQMNFNDVHGDRVNLVVVRPHANHSCLSSDVAGAVVEHGSWTFSVSIEIAEYITPQAGHVLDPFLKEAERKLANSLVKDMGSDRMMHMDEMSWLHAGCDNLGCMGSQLSSDIVEALVDFLDGISPDLLLAYLTNPSLKEDSALGNKNMHNATPNSSTSSLPELFGDASFLQAKNPQLSEGEETVQSKYPHGEEVWTPQALSASAGARVGVASVFHVLDRMKLNKAVENLKTQQAELPWWYRLNSQRFLNQAPTFHTRLNYQQAFAGLGYQAAYPLAFGLGFPLLRDKFHTSLHPNQTEYSVDSSILASTMASTLTHPFTVMSERRNLGIESSSELSRHVSRGIMASGVSSFLWGAAYGTTSTLLTEYLGPERTEKALIGVDALGSAAGIAVSSPFSYAAEQQYLNPNQQLSTKQVFRTLFDNAKASGNPVRYMTNTLGVGSRLTWGVPRFTLTQVAMRALWEESRNFFSKYGSSDV